MSDDGNQLNMKGLEQLIKALKKKPPVTRVGVLGSTSARNGDGGLTNATIGMFAEYGTSTSPIRSWLRMPLNEYFPKKVYENRDVFIATFKECMKSASLIPLAQQMGVLAEATILEGFDSGGFGQWPQSNMANKTNEQTLVETGQLRNAVTFDVKEGG